MPNWCQTTYIATGEPKQVRALYRTMYELQKCSPPYCGLAGEDFAMSSLIAKLGGNPNEMDCRGDWTELRLDDDGVELTFQTETAWQELSGWRKFVEGKFPGVKLWHFSEEPQNGYFRTNDDTGQYFPDQYVISDGNGESWFFDIESLADAVGERLGAAVPRDYGAIEELVRKHDLGCGEEDKFSVFEVERRA